MSELVGHAGALGFEIALIELVRHNDDRQTLDDADAVRFERQLLRRIVRQKLDVLHAEITKHARRHAVIAAIDRSADLDVGFDGVKPLILQRVSLDLLEETDAAASW